MPSALRWINLRIALPIRTRTDRPDPDFADTVPFSRPNPSPRPGQDVVGDILLDQMFHPHQLERQGLAEVDKSAGRFDWAEPSHPA